MASYAQLQTDLTDLIKDSEVSADMIRNFIARGEFKIQADLFSRKFGSSMPRFMLKRLEDQTSAAGDYTLPLLFKRAYAVRVGDYICRFAPSAKVPPNQDGFAEQALVLDYWERLPILSDTNTTNWLLDNQYNAYLYGSALHYIPRAQDSANLGLWSEFYNDAMTELKNSDSRAPRGQKRASTARYGAYYTVIDDTMVFGRAGGW